MNTVRVVQIVGARPQFIKLAPVSRQLARPGSGVQELIVHTGQHYDPQMSAVFFAELGIPPPAANLEVGSAAHGRQTAAMLERIEDFLLESRPDAVIVYGDTNSTLAGALAAAKLRLPVAHVEAGLRSYNRSMPEELNRVATDHLSDLLLAPTEAAVRNLAREGLSDRTRLVGDVMYDAVLANRELARSESRMLQQLGLTAGAFGLVTVHRAESTAPEVLSRVLALLERVSGVLPLVMPLHPRTRAAIGSALPDWRPPAQLRLIDPVGSLDMLQLTGAAAVVITDSGGLQKEAFILGTPCVTLRGETEWVETLECGANTLVGADTAAAVAAVQLAMTQGPPFRTDAASRAARFYGEGKAAGNCAQAVVELARGGTSAPGAAVGASGR